MADEGGAAPARTSDDNLNPRQRQRVDQAFEALFGYKWAVVDNRQAKNELPATATNDDDDNNSNASATATTLQVLSEILGRPAAARLLRSHRHLAHRKVQLVRRKRQDHYKVVATALRHRPHLPPPASASRKITPAAPADAASKQPGHAAAATAAAAEAMNKPAPAAAAAAVRKPAAKTAAAVDNLLQQLTGPNKVSTVAKTHSDWDQFKERTGLGETLEEQADSKTAFLKRQDFLQRVDQRTFEKERQERDRERAKRGT